MGRKLPKKKPGTSRKKPIPKSHHGPKTSSGPTEPSRPDVKRLFAVSGNRRAYAGRSTAIVDRETGSIIGEICHIKGEKLGAARHDRRQTDAERQSFANLVLMCGVHHKIIDDNETAFPVPRLRAMKANHERAAGKLRQLNNHLADKLIANITHNSVVVGSTVTSHQQLGVRLRTPRCSP